MPMAVMYAVSSYFFLPAGTYARLQYCTEEQRLFQTITVILNALYNKWQLFEKLKYFNFIKMKSNSDPALSMYFIHIQ
jgi:hypothetical protein